jgi:thioredoxin reductase/SAM-dependent methyltransferase
MHSYLGHDGVPPAELLAAGRAEVRSYGVEVLSGRAVQVAREGDRLVVELAGGNLVVARRVVAATGLVDELPDVEGLTQHWGDAVIHCPFCHGYEIRDQRVVVLVTHATGLHTAPLFRQLTSQLAVVLHDGVEIGDAGLADLRAAGVDVRAWVAERVVADAGGRLIGLELAGGERIEADSVVVSPRFRPRAEPFATVGLRPEPHPSGLGEVILVDATGATSVEGVYAVGNITDPSQQVLAAAAHGGRVGGAVAFSLAEEDLRAGVRQPGATVDWDHRYSGEQIWSGNPNGSLVAEAAGLTPGRALDVGAGEGGDALWLAAQGWQVTATDISARALDHIQHEAERRNLRVGCQLADANALAPFAVGQFDLVSACYASIPRTPDVRGVSNVLDAVAPGGTLVVIRHDPDAMRDPQHRHQAFDPDAYLSVDDFASALEDAAEWTIEVHRKRPRPPGSATAAHHVDDIVLRARRTS